MTKISENISKPQSRRGRPSKEEAANRPAPVKVVPTKQNQATLDIHSRFFEALDHLISSQKIASQYEFEFRFGLNHGNFLKLRNHPDKFALPNLYLFYMVEHYGISGDWLLTGKGEISNTKS